jgi:hypothetical protein
VQKNGESFELKQGTAQHFSDFQHYVGVKRGGNGNKMLENLYSVSPSTQLCSFLYLFTYKFKTLFFTVFFMPFYSIKQIYQSGRQKGR